VRIPDVNLLLYALDERAPPHERARSWLEQALSGSETVGLSWQVLVAFVRLSTRAAVFEQPLSADEAFDVVDGWLGQPPVTIVHPGRRHAAVLRELLSTVGTAGNLTTDAHLAALALEHGAELCSHDRDFGRFPGVRWVDPLA
jgi:uncharacterized protein